MLCFDLDNTLVDSYDVHVFAFQKAFKKRKLMKVSDAFVRKFLSMMADELIKKIYPELSEEEVREVIEDHNRYVVKYAKRFVKPLPTVKESLKKLKKNYKIGIISNSSHKEIIATLKAANISVKTFDVIIGNDEVEHGKPCPDEILKAEKLVHQHAEYMIGDSPYDVLAGKRAGCKTIAVLTGEFNRKSLKTEKPDYIVQNLKQTVKVITCQKKKSNGTTSS